MTSPLASYDPGFADQALRLAQLGATEETLARFFEVPVYTIYEWTGTIPAFAAALDQGWAVAGSQPPRARNRSRYPAYTFALRFAARTKRPDLAAALRTRMAEMKALGPDAMAAFNDALWTDVMALQPGRRIPERLP